MKANHPAIAPPMLYAGASVPAGTVCERRAEPTVVVLPIQQPRAGAHVARCGKDFKPVNMMKTVLAPAFRLACLV